MPKISQAPLTRIHIRLWQSDIAALHAMFDSTPAGFTGALRAIIHSFVTSSSAAASAEIDKLACGDFADLDLGVLTNELESMGEPK